MSDYSSEVKRGEFHWWTGVVESKGDPLKLGRCLVRIFGFHPEDKEQMPTSSLPWAQILLPTNSQNVYPPKHGDMVVGFFLDGAVGQQPVIMGTMPGIPLTEGNSEYPFSDARPEASLATSPRPPDSKEYVTDGTGVVITEADTAVLHPIFTDEPSTSRIARNDDDTITETFIQERIDNVTLAVPTAKEETWDEPETDEYLTVDIDLVNLLINDYNGFVSIDVDPDGMPVLLSDQVILSYPEDDDDEEEEFDETLCYNCGSNDIDFNSSGEYTCNNCGYEENEKTI
jgi:hypothetical protein